MNNPPGFTPPPFGYGPPPMPPQPPPMMNPYVQPPMGPRTHGLAVASMICGILAIIPGCCCGLFGMPLSAAAVVMGIISISQINSNARMGVQLGGKGMAIAGLACGGVAIAGDVVGMMFNVGSEVLKSMHV